MAGPDDAMAADVTGYGHLRASRTDHEHVLDTLKGAFVQGRLTKDELDERVGQTFAARTYAELAAVTADIPVRQTAGQSATCRPCRVWSGSSGIMAHSGHQARDRIPRRIRWESPRSQ
jgi:hypothetical protein